MSHEWDAWGKSVITQATLSNCGYAGGGFMALPLPELCTYVCVAVCKHVATLVGVTHLRYAVKECVKC